MSLNNSKLDYSAGGASAESSMVKSWISIKDIKKMVNPQKGQQIESNSGSKEQKPLKSAREPEINLEYSKISLAHHDRRIKNAKSFGGEKTQSTFQQQAQTKKKHTKMQSQSSMSNLLRSKNESRIGKGSDQFLQPKKSLNLEIKTNIDQNYQIEEESMLIDRIGDDSGMMLNYSDHLNCILDTYDKDCEKFQGHIDKIRQQNSRLQSFDKMSKNELIANKENAKIPQQYKVHSIASSKPLSENKNISNQQSHAKFKGENKNSFLNQELVSSPRIIHAQSQSSLKEKHGIIKSNYDSQETSKRSSNEMKMQKQLLSFKQLPSLKDCHMNQVRVDSQMQTERRGDAKLITKLQNDIELLNELLDEEKEKNEHLTKLIQQIKEQQTEAFNALMKRNQELEKEKSELKDELQSTKSFYEEMIQGLQIKIQQASFCGNQQSQLKQSVKYTGLSKIEQSKINRLDFSNNDDLTLQELGLQFSPNQVQNNNGVLNKLKQNNINPYVNNQRGKAGKLKIDMNSSTNNSNILMTSDYQQPSNVSATISQLDNFNRGVKLLNHFNKTLLGDKTDLKSPKNTFQVSFIGQDSSLMEGDDSVICEESGINVQQIRTGNFHIKRLEDVSQLPLQQNHINIEGDNIEFQINSLIHQIDGYLLSQTNEFNKKSSRRDSRRESNYFMNHLATFGGQQVAASLTGTQQFSQIWSNMQNEEARDFYSKRISVHEGSQTDDKQSNDYIQAKFIHNNILDDQQQTLLINIEESLFNFKQQLHGMIKK